MKEIEEAIKYYTEIDGAVSPFNKKKKSVVKTALAALRTMEWLGGIPEHKFFKMDIVDKFNSYLKGE